MKPGLSLRVSQHLALTPQLQQSIRLLQLSTLELSQEVEQMLDENPFLELAEERAEREDFGLGQADAPVSLGDHVSEVATEHSTDHMADSSEAEWEPSALSDDPSWEGDGTNDFAADDSEWGVEAKARTHNNDDDEEADAVTLARSGESLQDYLHRQTLSLRVGAEDSAALRFLIESLNDDGYLEESIEDLAQSLRPESEEQYQQLLHHFRTALSLLHSLEPVGVGARNLAECMALQIRHEKTLADKEGDDDAVALWQTALAVSQQPAEWLARRDVKRLVQAGCGSEADVREALQRIARLEPKPGRRFVQVERNIVVPDVIVTLAGKVGGMPRFRVLLNPDVMPRLRVHDIYANALRGQRGGESSGALQQRLQEARWFIKNIQQRFDTILRVSNAIVERQKGFFTHGELAMRPLVLREIADELGLHESTISRVTTAKYMATPFGTFELKYFFGSGLGTDAGGNASSTAVRALIKQFIANEDTRKPLSDSQLSDMLKEQGIDCARRTVAKYREGLKIPTATLRKAL
ncbi:RNA polymerase factor sigma-54 [Curvibacter sp. CHRR-16]|uniref:RNA polymerase factor sigma-54 n=1 Tax=Curvibacter sp. CHRR-16 TaxID=2835872 RepID=UPI001BD93874|nr:RNA polymerase factor sigma-54 [Curvibacter sp. CHRR-16]MBT0569695.1 RNA polymerase factor sigma-54 [Curvibacter sp. CHRR-16]